MLIIVVVKKKNQIKIEYYSIYLIHLDYLKKNKI